MALRLHPTTAAELEFVLAAEADLEAAPWIIRWSSDEHQGALSVAARGRGLGREALELVLDHAFGELGAHRVWLDVKVDNERARRACAAAGFVDEGVLRDALLTGGRVESLAVLSILEHEWSR